MSDKQCHLGDVCGEPVPPMRPIPRRQYRHPRWVENGTSVVIGAVAVTIFGALMVVFLVLLFMLAAAPVLAQKTDQIKPPRACAQLAALFGATLPNTITRAEAQAALNQINLRMILVPEARACHKAIKMELRK